MNILEEIVSHTREEVSATKKSLPLERLKEMPHYTRPAFSLQNALREKPVAVIAEIKKASPSKNIIRGDFNPMEIAAEYISGGASAISVLTDQKYFQGNITYIADIRPLVPIPILRKDFIVDSYQLAEAKAFGADAILLIAAALEPAHLRELHAEANALGLDCLVEVHNDDELDSLDLDAVRIVGINNRNLSTFEVDLSVTARLAPRIPQGMIIVSESGIGSRMDLVRLAAYGVRAVLVGESLMRAPHPGVALRALLTPSEEAAQ